MLMSVLAAIERLTYVCLCVSEAKSRAIELVSDMCVGELVITYVELRFILKHEVMCWTK